MKTDTAFRNSSLENLFLKVVVRGTSKHWSYRTGLLVIWNYPFVCTSTSTVT